MLYHGRERDHVIGLTASDSATERGKRAIYRAKEDMLTLPPVHGTAIYWLHKNSHTDGDKASS
jgi:hypothetical protein